MDPLRVQDTPKGSLGRHRGLFWKPKWTKRPLQSAKMPPRWCSEGDCGLPLGALGAFWVTSGVILDTSGRQRGHFFRKALELRKTNEFLGNP